MLFFLCFFYRQCRLFSGVGSLVWTTLGHWPVDRRRGILLSLSRSLPRLLLTDGSLYHFCLWLLAASRRLLYRIGLVVVAPSCSQLVGSLYHTSVLCIVLFFPPRFFIEQGVLVCATPRPGTVKQSLSICRPFPVSPKPAEGGV